MHIPFLDIDLIELIRTIGYLGIFLIVFAESGLFFGFFLPGDSLLFTSGFLASQGFLNIKVLVPIIVIGAIGGDSAGYWMGKKLGGWLMKQKESFFFQKDHLKQAEHFYKKHGGKTLILARFIPAVRTFVPIVAGMANMHYDRFISYNVFGGLFWGAGMTLAGYYLGSIIPGVDRYLLPIVVLIIFLSVLPGIIHMRKNIINRLKKHKIFFILIRIKRFWLG
jgi:membrane-associated protein